IARGFMITVGYIQTLKCHSNACPVGVATTDPDLQKALVIDEKKHRTANYLLTLRKGLFRLAAAAGLDRSEERRVGKECRDTRSKRDWSSDVCSSDLIARGFMITVGYIQTLKCHSNACPVGVATTDPDLQKALVIDEKKHRTANYLLTLRKGLFRLAAAAGLD